VEKAKAIRISIINIDTGKSEGFIELVIKEEMLISAVREKINEERIFDTVSFKFIDRENDPITLNQEKKYFFSDCSYEKQGKICMNVKLNQMV